MSTLRVDNIQDQGGAERRGLKTYAIICDKKAYNVDGGTFTSGAWRTRDLNHEIADPDGIVSIASNQFTLGAGDYLIEASVPAYKINRHITRLQDITAGTTVKHGSTEYTYSGDNVLTRSVLLARVSLTGSTTFEIQHRSQNSYSTNGMGINSSFTGTDSIYTIVKIFKEA
tara:strand:+ start:382 stop:894 length:513 start_codon:yes stop_codon:yes gene_type:complete